MRYPGIFFSIMLLMARCSKPTATTDSATPGSAIPPTIPDRYSTLVIDEQHEMIGSNSYAVYQINASSGVRLDATQFHFTFGTNVITPNMVQFIGSNSVFALSNPTE